MEENILYALQNRPEEGIALLMEHYGHLCRHIIAFHLAGTGSAEDLQDCLSAVFEEIYKARFSIDLSKGSLKGFVCVIAKRKAILWYQELLRHKVHTENCTFAEDAPHPGKFSLTGADEIQEAELRLLLTDALASLGKPDNQILMLKYYYGYPSREIARFLGLTVSAVDQRSRRALSKIKKLLQEVAL